MNLDRARGALRLEREGEVLIDRVAVADTFRLRAIGLMCRTEIPEACGDGLFFPRCRELHTCFMRFPLDVLFLDAEGQALEARRNVTPWRIARGPRGTRHCLEVKGGTLPETAGTPLSWRMLEGWRPADPSPPRG